MLEICNHPLISHDLNRLRNSATQPEEFRRLIRKISVFLTYEAVRSFETIGAKVTTPLETMDSQELQHPDPILVSILRAGNGFLDGALDVLPRSKVGFLGMYRDEDTLKPVHYYSKIPTVDGNAPVILLDPMLATGNSAADAVEHIQTLGAQNIYMLSLVAAPEGVKRVQLVAPDIKIFVAALDRGLNEKGYIVPGLGDAGDRIFNSL